MRVEVWGSAGFGFWVLGFGFWVLGSGFWVLNFGIWVMGSGLWVLGFGFWGLCFGLGCGSYRVALIVRPRGFRPGLGGREGGLEGGSVSV